MKRACEALIVCVEAPDSSLVRALINDNERSEEDKRKLYLWQAPPHSITLNQKKVFLHYLEKDITDFADILQCLPFVGIVSKTCDIILINDGDRIRCLRDTKLKPKFSAIYQNNKYWYNSYNEATSWSIEDLSLLSNPQLSVVLNCNKTRFQRNIDTENGMVTNVATQCDIKADLGVAQLILTQGMCDLIQIYHSDTWFVWNNKKREMIHRFFLLTCLMVTHELPKEFTKAVFFINNHFLWEVVRESVYIRKRGRRPITQNEV